MVKASCIIPDILEINSVCKGYEFRTEKNSAGYAYPMGWGKRLQARLDELGWGIPDLAREMGHPDDQALKDRLYKYTKDKVDNPRGDTLKNIATAIHWTESELRGQSGAPVFDPEFKPVGVLTSAHVIREIDVRVGLGGGGYADREVRRDGNHADPVKEEAWSFPISFIREELRAAAARIVIFETQGDSMLPTLSPGERVLVDTGHKVPSPDGIYALRDSYGSLIVKRLQTLRRGEPPRLMVLSDNPAHAPEEVGADEIEIVGRVVCSLRRF